MAKRRATKLAILGAIAGGFEYKQRQWETERAQAAEIAKEQRLEAILMAREGRDHERALELRSVDADISREARLDSQDHDVALAALRSDLTMREIAERHRLDIEQMSAQQIHEMARLEKSGEITRTNSTHDAKVRAEYRQDTGEDYVTIEGPGGQQKVTTATDLHKNGMPQGWRQITTRGMSSSMPAPSKLGLGGVKPVGGVAPATVDYSNWSHQRVGQ